MESFTSAQSLSTRTWTSGNRSVLLCSTVVDYLFPNPRLEEEGLIPLFYDNYEEEPHAKEEAVRESRVREDERCSACALLSNLQTAKEEAEQSKV
jgi:hypothetical protein